MLRGNHENEQLNERARSFGGGFAEECLAKYGPRSLDELKTVKWLKHRLVHSECAHFFGKKN